jgi:hypothetical protein
MGMSEWGIELTQQADIDALLKMIADHNLARLAEDLRFHAIIVHDGQKFACIGNGGGREETSEFIEKYPYNFKTIYYPFLKPSWWNSCDDYLWKAKTDNDVPKNIF